MSNYAYPIDLDWSHEEMTKVIHFFNQVEQAYESHVDSRKVLESYRGFKEVVRSIGTEKKIGREFEQVSGYSIYHVVQMAKNNEDKKIKMK